MSLTVLRSSSHRICHLHYSPIYRRCHLLCSSSQIICHILPSSSQRISHLLFSPSYRRCHLLRSSSHGISHLLYSPSYRMCHLLRSSSHRICHLLYSPSYRRCHLIRSYSYRTCHLLFSPSYKSRAGNSLICSFYSIQMSNCEQFAQIAQDKWATLRSLRGNKRPWANRSGCSRQMSDSLKKFWLKKPKILFFSMFYIRFFYLKKN